MKSLTKLCLVVFLALFITTTLPTENAEAGILKTIGKVLTFVPKTVYKGVSLLVKATVSKHSNPDGSRHGAIVIDGSEQFGTYAFDGAKRSRLKFEVYVPFINPDRIPSYVVWHWGNQTGHFSLKGKDWPIGRTKYEVGTLRATKSYYEDKLVVEVYYEQRFSRHDHNGKLHYQLQPMEKPLAKGTLNVVCWGKKW